MTADHFEEWFGTKLLPNVPPNSLIVMDNASYHSRCSDPVPVKSWTKQKMQDWLQAKGVEFPTNASFNMFRSTLKTTICLMMASMKS